MARAMGSEPILVCGKITPNFKNGSKRESWEGSFSHTDTFHERFVLFGYLAGLTEKIQMTTGILILPQRQTARVAKQAAAVDVLTEAGWPEMPQRRFTAAVGSA